MLPTDYSDETEMGSVIASSRLPVAVVDARNNNAGDNPPSSEEEPEPAPKPTFDTVLPSEHSYLGSDMEVLSGRTFLEDNCYHSLLLLPPSGVVLVPGQTLPLTVSDRHTIAMLRHCVNNDRTFGVIASWSSYSEHFDEIADIGTTAEIYEYQMEEGHNNFRIKAKARQRFKVIEMHRQSEGFYVARVRILPEVTLPDALLEIRMSSLNRLRKSQPLRCRRRDAMLTTWPSWVYDQYETNRLIDRVEKELKFLKRGRDLALPRNPTDLSFWVAQNLPIEPRLVVLRLNSPIQRLRWELSVLQKCQTLSCTNCSNIVGHQKNVFAMSVEGPQGTYVNPDGYLHETVTLSKAQGLVVSGHSSTRYSWFPGYAWCIAHCRHCKIHMGWKFIATRKDLKPNKFWGLSRRSLKVKINMESDENDIHVI
ncbi:protein cereblon-like isoform X2 [Lycorma delicatula]|uniref:protein cereblon-like isoform X2 n=1 Tax=Lycorma delicatula TaxID=130591 RepID=UPI003F518845